MPEPRSRGDRGSQARRALVFVRRYRISSLVILGLAMAGAVLGAIVRLIRGRTTFVVAHRLATVVDADRILVLRNGVIEETGSHPELMDAGGYYASLVRRQTRGRVAA